MTLKTMLIAGAALAAATGAQAQTANFALSETFDNGYNYTTNTSVPVVLTGTFSGTLNGQVITNLSNISLFLNGVAFNGNGHLYTAQYVPGRGIINSGGGQLSLDNSANNALISDSDLANGNTNDTNRFFSVPQNPDLGSNYPLFVGYNNGDYPNQVSHLVITQVNAAAVPEPASWATMALGFGLLGAGLRRRAAVRTGVRFA